MLSFKHFLPVLVGLGVGAVYLGWVYNARQQPGVMEKAQKAKELEAAEFINQNYGGDDVKIVQFAARSYAIRPGEKGLLCYGVLNAKAVRVQPHVEDLHPSMTFCFNVSPAKTTTYKLIAEDKAGKTVNASLTLTVK